VRVADYGGGLPGMGVFGFGSPFGVGGANTVDELSSSPPGTAITTGDGVGIENTEEGQAVHSDQLVSEYEIYGILGNSI
jgi:hypothetical protein